MSMTLKEQAWQSGLVLLDETFEWNENDWPSLEGGCRCHHATVVLDHSDKNDNNNNKRQTVVVLGGMEPQNIYSSNSVLILKMADPDKQWREGPPMNKRRRAHAAVVCNGGVYVMGGDSLGSTLNCIERIDANDLLQSSLTTTTTQEGHWTTLKCRLSTKRRSCCAVAVHNRYIVISGGRDKEYTALSSVEILDTSNDIVTTGPSMNGPRSFCASAVVGQRIFVVGGRDELDNNLDSVEYLEFAKSRDTKERKDDNSSAAVISFSSTWNAHSDLVLSHPRSTCAVVAVGSCLVMAGGRDNPIVEVDILDTHRNRVWNLPPFGNDRADFTLVTVANQVAAISGFLDHSCATFGIVDKCTWCFRRLCEQHPNRCFHSRQGMHIGDINATSCTTSTSIRKRVRTNTCHDGKEEDCTANVQHVASNVKN